jgi:hypothetical protein
LKRDKWEKDAGVDSLRHEQFTESIGNEDSKQKDCAGYPDESKKDIECLFYWRYVNGSD